MDGCLVGEEKREAKDGEGMGYNYDV